MTHTLTRIVFNNRFIDKKYENDIKMNKINLYYSIVVQGEKTIRYIYQNNINMKH